MNETGPDKLFTVQMIQVMTEGVKDRAAFLPMCRMNEHTGRHVYHYDLAVFIDNIQRQLLRQHRRFPVLVQLDLKKIPAAHPFPFVLDAAVDLTVTVSYHVTNIHSAESVKTFKEILFEPHPNDPFGNCDLENLRHGLDSRRFNLRRETYILVDGFRDMTNLLVFPFGNR